MTCFGAVRHVSDIRADDSCPEGQGELTQTAKTNIFASQKGMTCFGSVRHGPDIRADDASSEGLSTLTLQTGTNQYASQSGMRGFGSVRHGPDIKVIELYDEGNDDEYPTDEDEPLPTKPAKKFREEVYEVEEPPQKNVEIEKKTEPETLHAKSPEIPDNIEEAEDTKVTENDAGTLDELPEEQTETPEEEMNTGIEEDQPEDQNIDVYAANI